MKSIWVEASDEVKLENAKNMSIKCIKKGETHYLIEPTTKYVNFGKEEKEGNVCFVADWVKNI